MRHTGVIRAADADVLRCYCEAVGRYAQAARLYASRAPIASRDGNLVKNPLHQVARDNADEIRQFARELGLSPSARVGLRIEPEHAFDALTADIGLSCAQLYVMCRVVHTDLLTRALIPRRCWSGPPRSRPPGRRRQGRGRARRVGHHAVRAGSRGARTSNGTQHLPQWSASGSKINHQIALVGYNDTAGTYSVMDTCGPGCNSSGLAAAVRTINQDYLWTLIHAETDDDGII